MKILRLIILILIISSTSRGQGVYTKLSSYGYEWKRGLFDKTLSIPEGDTLVNSVDSSHRFIIYKTSNNTVYTYNSSTLTWRVVGGSGDMNKIDSNRYANYTTKTYVDGKVQTIINDSLIYISILGYGLSRLDTVLWVDSAKIVTVTANNAKVNKSDTTTYSATKSYVQTSLSGYIKKADSNTNGGYSSYTYTNTRDALKINKADSNVYGSYVTKTYVDNITPSQSLSDWNVIKGSYFVGASVGVAKDIWSPINITSPFNSSFVTTFKVSSLSNALPNSNCVRFISGVSSNTPAFIRTNLITQAIYLGTSLNSGSGVQLNYIGGYSNFATGMRNFIGYAPLTTPSVTSTSNPSAMINMFGVGFDASDNQLYIMHNDGSGTATKIATGFLINQGNVYTISISVPYDYSNVVITVIEKTLSTSTSFTSSITTNLPAANLYLYFFAWMGCGTTTTQSRMDLINVEEIKTISN